MEDRLKKLEEYVENLTKDYINIKLTLSIMSAELTVLDDLIDELINKDKNDEE